MQTLSSHPKHFLTDRKNLHIYTEIKEGSLGEPTCLFSQLSQYASDKINTVGLSVLYSRRECLQFGINTSLSLEAFGQKNWCLSFAPRATPVDRRSPTPQLILCQQRGGLARRAALATPSLGLEELGVCRGGRRGVCVVGVRARVGGCLRCSSESNGGIQGSLGTI